MESFELQCGRGLAYTQQVRSMRLNLSNVTVDSRPSLFNKQRSLNDISKEWVWMHSSHFCLSSVCVEEDNRPVL